MTKSKHEALEAGFLAESSKGCSTTLGVEKEVGSRKLSLTHTHNTHTLFFSLSFLSLPYQLAPIESTSWPIDFAFLQD